MATKFVIEEYDKAQQEKEEAERKKGEEEDEYDDEEMLEWDIIFKWSKIKSRIKETLYKSIISCFILFGL